MPTLQFISGSGSGSTVAQGVVGQIAALNASIAAMNLSLNTYFGTGASTSIPSISFYLNGNLVTVTNPDPTMTLLTYIRNYTNYFGTKSACQQGGCGACVVMQSLYDADSGLNRNISINTCLKLLIDCDGTVITTVEGIKYTNPTYIGGFNEYHPVQERLWKTSGFQCGGCTSGMIMSLYTALQPNTYMQALSGSIAGIDAKKLLEKNIDGNICRCSAYHGIMKTARSFNPYWQYTGGVGNALSGYQLTTIGTDGTGATGSAFYNIASQTYNQRLLAGNNVPSSITIASVNTPATVYSSFQSYNSSLDVNGSSTSAYYGKNVNYSSWLQNYVSRPQVFTTTLYGYNSTNPTSGYTINVYRYTDINTILNAILTIGFNNVKIQNGWTSIKVPGYAFNPSTYQSYVDTSKVQTLQTTSVTSTGATFGANTPINKVVNLLQSSSDAKWKKMADHLFYISGNHVRNASAIIGSLAMAKQGFSSDVAPVLLAGRATLSGYYISSTAVTPFSGLSIDNYLSASTTSQMIFLTSVTIPASVSGEFYWSYRVAMRQLNSHAMLNMGFNTIVSGSSLTNSIVAYGALGNTSGSTVQRASTTESYLNSTFNLSSSATGALNTFVAAALTRAQTDITVTPLTEFANSVVSNYNTQGRQQLVSSLLYAGLLQLINTVYPLETYYPSILTALEDWVHNTTQGASDNTYQYIFNPIGTSSLTGEDAATYPVHQSFVRFDGINIASGEARYTDDMPKQAIEYYLAVVGSTVSVGSVDFTSPSGIAARTASKNFALSVPGVIDYFDSQDILATVANGGLGGTNIYTSSINNEELLGNVLIKYLGQRVAVVVANSPELAQRVASICQSNYPYVYKSVSAMPNGFFSGNKNYFTAPALSIYDAVSKGYISGSGTGSTGTNTYLGKNAQNRGRIQQPARYFPFQTGDAGYEVFNTTPNVGLAPNGWTGSYINPYNFYTGADSQLYYTGANGLPHLWSPYVFINSTGIFMSEVYHAYIEKNSANCYRDEEGNYVMYVSTQVTTTANSIVGIGAGAFISPILLPANKLILKGRRLGGSFGGKLGAEMYYILCLAACIRNNGAMCRWVPSIQEDSQHNGARGDIWSNFNSGFNASGALQSVEILHQLTNPAGTNQAIGQVPCRSGGHRNLGDVMGYFKNILRNVPNYNFDFNCGWVPRPFPLAYRAAQNGEAALALANMFDDIAAITGLNFTDVQIANAPPPVQEDLAAGVSPTVWSDMYTKFTTDPKYNYTNRYSYIYGATGFNAINKYKKRALSIGYSTYESNKGNGSPHDVTIRICPNGDVHVWAAFIDVGNGGFTKISQVISNQLGVPISAIYYKEYNRELNWGEADTGGSQATFDACLAAVDACNQLKSIMYGVLGASAFSGGASAFTGAGNSDLLFTVPTGPWNNGTVANSTSGNGAKWGAISPMIDANTTYNLTDYSRKNNNIAWRTLINCMNNIGLFMTGAYGNGGGAYGTEGIGKGSATQINKLVATGNEVNYRFGLSNAYQATMVEVEVDAITGNVNIVEVDILSDLGNNVNPLFDSEQFIGGYTFAMGMILEEQRTYDSTGKQLINDTWNYKPLCSVQNPNTIKFEVMSRNFEGVTSPDPQFTLPYGSKSAGEQGVTAAAVTLGTIKGAIREFRKQNSLNPQFNVLLPITPDEVVSLSGYSTTGYKLY